MGIGGSVPGRKVAGPEAGYSAASASEVSGQPIDPIFKGQAIKLDP